MNLYSFYDPHGSNQVNIGETLPDDYDWKQMFPDFIEDEYNERTCFLEAGKGQYPEHIDWDNPLVDRRTPLDALIEEEDKKSAMKAHLMDYETERSDDLPIEDSIRVNSIAYWMMLIEGDGLSEKDLEDMSVGIHGNGNLENHVPHFELMPLKEATRPRVIDPDCWMNGYSHGRHGKKPFYRKQNRKKFNDEIEE